VSLSVYVSVSVCVSLSECVCLGLYVSVCRVVCASYLVSLTYLGKMIFPIDFFDVYYSCVFFSYMFLCLHFFLSNCMELCDITEPQESFY